MNLVGETIEKKVSSYNIVVLGVCIGFAVFCIIYGITPLNMANDRWIMQGYDETDIIQHYAGWCAFRNSEWHFPLGLADPMAYGTVITYTDSIPLMAILSKILLQIIGYQGTFQYFGVFTLICYILQAIAAGMLLKRKTYNKGIIAISMLLLCFSPILMERAVRHTALGAQWLILFAMESYFRYRDSSFAKYPKSFFALSILAMLIHPYFIPMVMSFAFIGVVSAFIYRNIKAGIIQSILMLGNVGICALSGVVIGAVGNGSTLSREGYGYYSMNLNALINPISTGGYEWSSFLGKREQLKGNLDGFNYLGVGILFLIAVAAVLLMMEFRQLKKVVRGNCIYFAVMLFMTAFAVSNVVTFDARTLFTIPIGKTLTRVCGVFRASSRMFYPVYYTLLIWVIYFYIEKAEYIFQKFTVKKIGHIILVLGLIIQLCDLHEVIYEKHKNMEEYSAKDSILDDTVLGNRVSQYKYMTSFEWDRSAAVLAYVNKINTYYTVANSGTYYKAWADDGWAWVKFTKGVHDMNTIYTTRNKKIAEILKDISDGMDCYEIQGHYFFFPVAEDHEPVDTVVADRVQGNVVVLAYSDEAINKVDGCKMILMGRNFLDIVEVTYDADWIYVELCSETAANKCVYPNELVFY